MTFITSYCILRNNKIVTARSSRQIGGESLDAFLDKLYNELEPAYPKFYKMDPQCRAGFLASELLLRERPIHEYPPGSVAVVLANASASLDTDIRFEQSIKSAASPSLFVYTLPNIVTGEICIRHGITGENAFFVTGRFDAALLAHYTDLVLAQDYMSACVAGWVDVLGQNYDVFLYLVEKQKLGPAIEHNDRELEKLHEQYYGTIDGRPEKADH